MHVMTAYIYRLCIHEDDTNSPKENVAPPLPITYPNIYPIVIPNIISYGNTSYFIIVFFSAVHAVECTTINQKKCIAMLEPQNGNLFVFISNVGLQHRDEFI